MKAHDINKLYKKISDDIGIKTIVGRLKLNQEKNIRCIDIKKIMDPINTNILYDGQKTLINNIIYAADIHGRSNGYVGVEINMNNGKQKYLYILTNRGYSLFSEQFLYEFVYNYLLGDLSKIVLRYVIYENTICNYTAKIEKYNIVLKKTYNDEYINGTGTGAAGYARLFILEDMFCGSFRKYNEKYFYN